MPPKVFVGRLEKVTNDLFHLNPYPTSDEFTKMAQDIGGVSAQQLKNRWEHLRRKKVFPDKPENVIGDEVAENNKNNKAALGDLSTEVHGSFSGEASLAPNTSLEYRGVADASTSGKTLSSSLPPKKRHADSSSGSEAPVCALQKPNTAGGTSSSSQPSAGSGSKRGRRPALKEPVADYLLRQLVEQGAQIKQLTEHQEDIIGQIKQLAEGQKQLAEGQEDIKTALGNLSKDNSKKQLEE